MTTQPDLFAAAAEERARATSLAEQRAELADERRDADILARMLGECHRALDVLCPACREAFDARLAEEPLI